MSTKSLKRTVVEGGRRSWSKYRRRYSHAQDRAEERVFLQKLVLDPDYAEEDDVSKTIHVPVDFDDKLGALDEYLRSQIGKLWDDVRSDIFNKFDIRTTQGRHVVFDHLLSYVNQSPSGFDKYGYVTDPDAKDVIKGQRRYWKYKDFYVNKDGILCLIESKRYSYKNDLNIGQQYKPAETWLNGRIIGKVNNELTWFLPTEGIWMTSYYHPYKHENVFHLRKLRYFLWEKGFYEHDLKSEFGIFVSKSYGMHWEHIENPFSFKQRAPLSKEEIEIFNSFPERIREDILKYSKGR
jgi:hypothetical protein